MSQRYDAYLQKVEDKGLSLSQSQRFNAICHQFDDGWSGAVYNAILKRVYQTLNRMRSN